MRRAVIGRERLHPVVASLTAQTAEPSAARQDGQPRKGEPRNQTVVERLMHVTHGIELGAHGAAVDLVLIAGQPRGGGIAGANRVEGGLRGQHPRPHGEVDALQSQRVEKPARVARNEASGEVRPRDGVPPALRQCLGPVADHLAALEQPPHERMPLEAVERHVRIEQRIPVVEARHEADRELAVRHRIDESAAELLVPQRIPHRVHDRARFESSARHLPQLFHTDGKLLGLPAAPQGKAPQQLLGEVAAHAVAEDRHLGQDVDARLERRLPRAVAVDAAVAGADADHAVAVGENLLPGKPREEIDAAPVHLLGQPADEPVERHDVVAVIAQRRRDDGKSQARRFGEEIDAIALHLGGERRPLLAKVRNELAQRRRIEHRARQHVRARLPCFFEYRDT